MRILITGVGGFIGFHTAKKFLNKKNIVVGIDSMNKYYDLRLKKKRIEILRKFSIKNKCKFIFFNFNLCSVKKTSDIFKKFKFEKVVHFAAQAGVRYSLKNPREYFNSNLNGFFNILENCKNFNVKRLIFASSSSVYGNQAKSPFKENFSTDNPIQFYAATKKANEVMAYSYSKLYQIEMVCLRFFTVYGPWGRPDMALFDFVKKIINKKSITLFNYGKHTRDFTYIDDAVKGIEKSLHFKFKKLTKIKYIVFNVGYGKNVELITFVKIIEKLLNIKAKIKFLPLQKGDVVNTFSNISKTKKYLKYNPKININSGIKKFLDWYMKYYKIRN